MCSCVCVCVVGCLPHYKEMIVYGYMCVCVSERVHYCSIEGMALLSFSKKSCYHMYIGVGWSEMFMFLFTFLSSGVIHDLWIVLLAGLTFYKCAARWWRFQSVLPAARGLFWIDMPLPRWRMCVCVCVISFSEQRRFDFLRSILGWLVVCRGGSGGNCGVGHRCCFCSDNCHCGSGSINKRRSTLN